MRFVKYLAHEYILVFIISLIALGASVYPTLYGIRITPAGTKFSLASNFFPDYYQYLGWMKDVELGNLAISTRFTAEKFPPRIAFPYLIYPIIGKLGSTFGLTMDITYTAARVLFGGMRILLVYLLIGQLFTDKKGRISALIFSVFSASFFKLYFADNQLKSDFFLPGITNFDIFTRTAFIPHHLLSHIFNIWFFVYFYKALRDNNTRYSLIAGLFLLLACLINPAAILFMGFVLPTAFILLTGVKYKSIKRPVVRHFTISSIALLISVIYYRFYFFTVFPWDYFHSSVNSSSHFWNLKSLPEWTFADYLGVLGISLPLAALSVFAKKFRKKTMYLLLLAWSIAPIIAFVFLKLYFDRLQMVFRIFQAQQYVPLGILGTIGIYYIFEKFKSRMVIIPVFIFLISVSLPYYFLSMKSQIDTLTPNNYFIFLPVDSYNSFRYLNMNTPRDSVVLAGYYMGKVLPAYTHNRVYIGRDDLTYDYQDKLVKFTDFFSNKMTEEEAKDFFEDGNIKYIYLGPDTGNTPDEFISGYKSVKLIYKSGINYIYQVI